MRSSTVLRICVVLEWAFVALGIALSFLLESRLPAPLQEWLAADSEGDLKLREVAVLILMIPLLLCALAGSIGLLFLKHWAAWLYLISLVVGFIVLPFMGPTVEHALADAVDEVSVMLSGVIVGVAFFSNALEARPGRAEKLPPVS